jgi:hypothetical protein
MKLTDVRIRNAKPTGQTYKLSDGAGMYLLVTKDGARYWRFDYRFNGKRRMLALGVYPTSTLSLARDRREAARKLLAEGKDPNIAMRETKRTAKIASNNTFETIAREWLNRQRRRLAPRYTALLQARLEADVFPNLGSRPIAEIGAPELLDVLQKVEKRGVARRISERTRTPN